jgi:flagellar P-ring protein FlgI
MKQILLRILSLLVLCSLFGVASSGEAQATRIKDLAEIQGVRSNQLVGYGLVVGLNGTGDDKKLLFTIRSVVNMLERMGITVNPKDAEVENVAAVMVTADLPAFIKAGTRIDVLVSSIGDADSLQGGTLLLTPLQASDGEVYAVAQGAVSIGGISASGGGATVQKNFPTVGRVVGGALIEKEIPLEFNAKTSIAVMLRNPDFTTASRVAEAINGALNDHFAMAPDAGTVEVAVPDAYSGKVVSLVTLLEGLDVIPDVESKVLINERTGTVVMGENVRISTVAVSHGNLSIQIKESPQVSQPLPFSTGETVVVPETEIVVQEERSPLFLVEAGVSIGEVVRALNALGVSPRDLISILQAIKSAGALQAKLEIM